MSRPLIVVFSFLLMPWCINAQMLDTIRDSFRYTPRPSLSLSTRYTFIDGFQKPVLGIKAGLDFNNTVRCGVGFSYLKEPYYIYKFTVDKGGQKSYIAEVKFWYVQSYIEYIFHKTKKWQFSLPLQIGAGVCSVSYFENENKIPEGPRALVLYEPVVSGHYKLTDWLALGSDIGYRFMGVSNSKTLNIQFSSPVYAFKTLIFWRVLYDKIF